MRRAELQELAVRRLKEAETLLDTGHWSGAYYLAGYAAEFALKGIIAGQFIAEDIPDKKFVEKIWTHNLELLLDLAGLKPELHKTAERFKANWNTVKGWNEAARYKTISEIEARAMLNALSDPNEGVFEWILSKL